MCTWKTVWSRFSFVTESPDFPVSLIYFLFQYCLVVLFQALLALEVGLSSPHIVMVLKLVKHCFKTIWNSIEAGAIYFMYLKLVTLKSTDTNSGIHSTNIWTFSNLQLMPLKTVVSFSKEKKKTSSGKWSKGKTKLI